jgi:hypothetical protein
MEAVRGSQRKGKEIRFFTRERRPLACERLTYLPDEDGDMLIEGSSGLLGYPEGLRAKADQSDAFPFSSSPAQVVGSAVLGLVNRVERGSD